MILDEYETTTHLKIHDNLQKLAAFAYVWIFIHVKEAVKFDFMSLLCLIIKFSLHNYKWFFV